MQHSIKEMGTKYQYLSDLRKDKERFNAKDFFNFAKDNHEKYSLVKNGDDILVSTWYSNDLISDYQKTI